MVCNVHNDVSVNYVGVVRTVVCIGHSCTGLHYQTRCHFNVSFVIVCHNMHVVFLRLFLSVPFPPPDRCDRTHSVVIGPYQNLQMYPWSYNRERAPFSFRHKTLQHVGKGDKSVLKRYLNKSDNMIFILYCFQLHTVR